MFLEPFCLLLFIQLTVYSQDPEQRVLDRWQGSKGLMPSMQYVPLPYHAVVPLVAQLEESSVKLEYQSSDSQVWPYPSSLGVSEAESPN